MLIRVTPPPLVMIGSPVQRGRASSQPEALDAVTVLHLALTVDCPNKLV